MSTAVNHAKRSHRSHYQTMGFTKKMRAISPTTSTPTYIKWLKKLLKKRKEG